MTAPVQITNALPLGKALADELGIASRLLGELAYDLSSDEATLRRHLTSLQAIDHVTQIMLAVADLLRAEGDSAELLASVTLESTAGRLRQAAEVAT